ncbi:MAG TPA: DUF1573 domain-containing protein [Pirellulaceae bacterium]
MKATIFGIIALVLGIATGVAWTRQEFAHEAVPVDLTPVTITKAGKPSRPTIGPKVTIVSGERHDFGAMERNAHGKHAYIVRNDGDAPLELSTGQVSCGVCIKVFAVAKPILAPGEQTDVHIEWDVKTGDAKFEQSGPLNTNDPLKPSVHLSLTGQVIDNVRVDRPDVHFHDLSPSESATASVNVYAFKEGDFKIESTDFTIPRVGRFLGANVTPLTDSELASEPKAKSGYKVTIDVKPGLPQGDFEDTLQITTNQTTDPLSVKVIGNIASDILLMGPNVIREKSLINLPAISQATGKKHTVYLIVKGPHRDDTNVTIDSIEPKKDFSATLGEPIHDTPKTKRYPITIEIPPGAAPGTYGDGSYAHIHVKTTHPEIKDIDIRVRYVVRE